jgi:hypothetical protein
VFTGLAPKRPDEHDSQGPFPRLSPRPADAKRTTPWAAKHYLLDAPSDVNVSLRPLTGAIRGSASQCHGKRIST